MDDDSQVVTVVSSSSNNVLTADARENASEAQKNSDTQERERLKLIDLHSNPPDTGLVQSLVTGVLMFFSYLILPLVIIFQIKIVKQWERAVILRLGRLQGKPRGPGMQVIMPFVDEYHAVDTRVKVVDVPQQFVLTRDAVTIQINAVVQYFVNKPQLAVTRIRQVRYSTLDLAQAHLRNVIGEFELNDILTKKDQISEAIRADLDRETDLWGVKVVNVLLKDIILPQDMVRALAATAERQREAQAKMIAAEGEYNASKKLAEAATVLQRNKGAMTLRLFQTLIAIGEERNSTVLIPLPQGILESLARPK